LSCPSNSATLRGHHAGLGGTIVANVPEADTLFAEVLSGHSTATVHLTLRTSADFLGLTIRVGGSALTLVSLWMLLRRRRVGAASRVDAQTKLGTTPTGRTERKEG